MGEDKSFDKTKLEREIKRVLKKEGGAAGLKPLVAVAKKLGASKKDLMGVLKKMNSVKKHRHGDYIRATAMVVIIVIVSIISFLDFLNIQLSLS